MQADNSVSFPHTGECCSFVARLAQNASQAQHFWLFFGRNCCGSRAPNTVSLLHHVWFQRFLLRHAQPFSRCNSLLAGWNLSQSGCGQVVELQCRDQARMPEILVVLRPHMPCDLYNQLCCEIPLCSPAVVRLRRLEFGAFGSISARRARFKRYSVSTLYKFLV